MSKGILKRIQQWKSDSHDLFEQFHKELKKEALGKGTYRKASNYLSSNAPEYLGHSAVTPDDYFDYAIKKLFNDVKYDISEEAMNQEVK